LANSASAFFQILVRAKDANQILHDFLQVTMNGIRAFPPPELENGASNSLSARSICALSMEGAEERLAC